MKPNSMIHRMGFSMWISFTLLAVGIALIFWIILGTSLRVSYQNENLQELDRAAWAAVRTYGAEDFENNLRFLARGEGYFVQIILEDDKEPLLALDNKGADGSIQAEGIIPKDLFAYLDENGGCYSYLVEDSVRNMEWAAEAVVIASQNGSREVLIFSKSLANVAYLIRLLNTRVAFSIAVVLVIASILSLVITKRFSGPIDRLTEKAEQLAQGRYQITFPKGGFYEVEKLSETLEMAAHEFNATEELRREFVANISHDMKTPLTVIQMYAEMIQTVSGEDREKREIHAERIRKEVEKLTEFINDTMDLARLQSKTWEMKQECFLISHLIQSVIKSFEIHHDLNQFQIETDLEEEYVYADRKLMGRVLENLIGNALKFSLTEKKIRIRARREKQLVKISVQDFGAGIEKEKISHIWERYYKIDPYGTNKTGTGIGLHIVKEIMELHQAEYGVESALGKGSIFWFCLKGVKE